MVTQRTANPCTPVRFRARPPSAFLSSVPSQHFRRNHSPFLHRIKKWEDLTVVAIKPRVTFIEQANPVDEYGRALYAVCRSIMRALIDSISDEDLADMNTPLDMVKMRPFAKVARLERDKGMRGDGFEWAVHEAILGAEPTVIEPVSQAMKRASKYVKDAAPTSILFGQERAKFLGFLDAVVDEAGLDSYLLPQGSGKPFRFGPWVQLAAKGYTAEDELNTRIKKIWKTDLFLSADGDVRPRGLVIRARRRVDQSLRRLRRGGSGRIYPFRCPVRRCSWRFPGAC